MRRYRRSPAGALVVDEGRVDGADGVAAQGEVVNAGHAPADAPTRALCATWPTAADAPRSRVRRAFAVARRAEPPRYYRSRDHIRPLTGAELVIALATTRPAPARGRVPRHGGARFARSAPVIPQRTRLLSWANGESDSKLLGSPPATPDRDPKAGTARWEGRRFLSHLLKRKR